MPPPRVRQVEFGPQELDIALRVRVQLLQEALERAQVRAQGLYP